MGSPDFREQLLYAAQQLDRCRIGYLHVMDGLAFGFHQLGQPVTLLNLRGVFHGPLMGNCGYTQETAEAAIRKAITAATTSPYPEDASFVAVPARSWKPLTVTVETTTRVKIG